MTTENNNEIFQEEKPEARASLLEANAFKVQEQTVQRSYTPEEMEVLRRELSDFSIDLQNKRNAAAAKIKELREEIRLTQEAVNDRVTKLTKKYEETWEKVYLFDDQEARRMRIYNRLGHLVSERPLLPDERQLKMLELNKTGTHG